jgi:Ca-activated chloride channel family protein
VVLRFLYIWFAAVTLTALVAYKVPAGAQESEHQICNEDAMIALDASGSMSGKYASANMVRRIEKVRSALAKVLPNITQVRRVGLITFGPGRSNQCNNVKLQLKPTPNAADLILGVVNNLVPTGGTPLTAAVEQAANVLDFRKKPGIIVLLTDGEETCGRSPCELGAHLHAEAKQLTIHVISLRVSGLSASMGEQTLLETKCLAEQNNGLYVPVDTEDDLIAALEKTLGCPLDLKAKVVGHRLNSSPLGEMQLLPKPWLGHSPAMKPSLSPTT